MEERKSSRREILKSMFRIIIAGLLGVIGLRSLFKGDPHVCISKGICGGCRVYNDCILPQAMSAKKAGYDGKGDMTGSSAVRPRSDRVS